MSLSKIRARAMELRGEEDNTEVNSTEVAVSPEEEVSLEEEVSPEEEEDPTSSKSKKDRKKKQRLMIRNKYPMAMLIMCSVLTLIM